MAREKDGAANAGRTQQEQAEQHGRSSGPQSQAQSASAEPEHKAEYDPEKQVAETGEPVFFDTTIAKLVERENERTGEKEWIEVMSDNLYPGEKLKRTEDAEKAKEKADRLRDDPNDGEKKELDRDRKKDQDRK